MENKKIEEVKKLLDKELVPVGDIQKLNDLKVYNPETRYKMRLNRSHRLYRYIKNVNSVDSAKKQIRFQKNTKAYSLLANCLQYTLHTATNAQQTTV